MENDLIKAYFEAKIKVLEVMIEDSMERGISEDYFIERQAFFKDCYEDFKVMNGGEL